MMRLWKVLLLGGSLACAMGCGPGAAGGLGLACARGVDGACGADTAEPGVRTKGGTVSARIWALIAQGQFAEAQVLIAESTAAGLLSRPQAAQMLERITKLTTRLGDVPARLKRVANFPSQLTDHTLFQIKQLLDRHDYSLATHAQLKLAEKMIEQPERLMEKAATLGH
jgi:hypothetical protein